MNFLAQFLGQLLYAGCGMRSRKGVVSGHGFTWNIFDILSLKT